MARLNEPLAPAESVDSLKRRFVRQNREIARVNSLQSLRIRGLESEVSSLLSENVSLRGQVISLSQEVERLEDARALSHEIYEVKEKLDFKLVELNNLVVDLGKLPRNFRNRRREAHSIDPDRENQSTYNPRLKATIPENTQFVEDGRLPVIFEDKSLDTTNLADLHDGDSDVIDTNHAQTPKSEPENEDTDAGDMQELSEGNMSGIGTDHDDAEEYDTLLPPTLETRKKKKLDSAAVPDKGNTLASDSATAEYGCQSIPNPEYKRRLEDGDRGSPPISVENNDDPQSNQPAYSPQSTVPPWTETPDSLPDQLEGQAPADDGLAQREILKPKSTNVSMGSPNKSRSTEQKEKCYQASSSEKYPEPYKPASRKRRLHERKGFVDMTVPKYQNFSQNEQASLAENHEEEALFAKKGSGSPVSELPVTQRWLEPGTTSDIPAVPSRATRRQRGVVSYAEPNLRGKMRRSTNEFVDAVAGHNSRDIRTSMDQGDVNEHEYSAELKVTMGDNLVDSNGSRSYKSERANRDTVSGSEGSLQVQSNKPTRRSVSKRKRGSLEDTCGPLNGQDNLDASMATDTSDWVQRDQQDCGMVETECGPISDSAALDQTRPVESTTKVNNTTHTTRKGSRRYSSNPRAAGAKRLPQDNLTVSEPRCASSTKEYDKLNIAVSSKTDSRIPGTEVQFIPCKSDAHSASLTGEVRVKHGQQLAARRRSTML